MSATAVSLSVGASNAASYSHFPDGATELLAAVATRGFERLTVVLGELPSSNKVLNAERRIRRLFLQYVRFGLENPHLYRAMFSPRLAVKLAAVDVTTWETLRGGRTYKELTVAKAVTYGAFADTTHLLDRSTRGQSFRRTDAAKAVATLAHGLILELIDEGIDLGTTTNDTRTKTRLKMASRLIRMLLQGVLTDGAQPRMAQS